MGLQQQLARVAAAIVLIAALAVPSLAIAHEGHAHHRPHVAPSSAAPSSSESMSSESTSSESMPSEATPADVRGQADLHGHEQPAAKHVVALTAARDAPTAAGGATRCGVGCCGGGAGMACCGAALAPDSFWIPFPQASAQLGIPRAPPLPGLPPEALPKPPKSIA